MPIIPTAADVRDWAEELQAVEREGEKGEKKGTLLISHTTWDV